MQNFLIGLGILVFQSFGSIAQAGLGPENVVVVVNGASADSRTVANHFVHLHQIPSRNVVVLEDVPEPMRVGLAEFRERILKPILSEIDGRKLSSQTKAIVYSAGFPYAVEITEHHQRIESLIAGTDAQADAQRAFMKKVFTPTASINGLTFFYRYVLADSALYLSPTANLYVRSTFDRFFANPCVGEETSRFEEAMEAAEQGGHEEAAVSFEALFVAHPTQHPLGILAARQFALAGKPDEAVTLIRRAVDAGWTSGRYLQAEKDLGSLLAAEGYIDLLETLDDAPIDFQPPIGFTQDQLWTRNGLPEKTSAGTGTSYMLSMMLAVTRGEGTSVDEAIKYLTRSAQATAADSVGTYYFTNTADVRTKTRTPLVAQATRFLDYLGLQSETVNENMPQQRFDCAGVMLGSPNFDWKLSKSRLLPGALADNLTSTGGFMAAPGQTKLTELLLGGAAASSGTVVEPYALQFKFPLPLMYPYYARGVSAIEAFYLSVSSPYQLLIVGDPLCQPHARPPRYTAVLGVGRGKAKGMLAVQITEASIDLPILRKRPSETPKHVELFVNGKLVSRSPPQKNLLFKESDLGPGVHEIRVCLVGNDLTEPRASRTMMHVSQAALTPTMEIASQSSTLIKVELKAADAEGIELMHHEELIGNAIGSDGSVQFESSQFGKGPVRVQPVAIRDGKRIPGRAIEINIP